jgi:hypothetical protein
MVNLASDLAQKWRSRLSADCPNHSAATRESIVHWLLGTDLERFETLNPMQMEIAWQAMEYRYRILQHRYLDLEPGQAYCSLLQRLGSLVLLRNKIRTWVALSRNRSSAVVDVLREVIQELLSSDRYMQQQMVWIAECTGEKKLRDALLFTSIEEYCLRPIRNQPLLVYRFINYLHRSQRGGLTQVPNRDLVRLVSEELVSEDRKSRISLLDNQAISQYKDMQAVAEQQLARAAVKQEFERYLAQKLGPLAVQWLQLYLQGQSQSAIARSLNLEIKQVYRLREKISYHAVQVFAPKAQPELVGNWLN